MTTEDLLQLKDVSFSYLYSDKLALKNINLTLNKGEFLVVLGIPTAGKTTLLMSLNALIPNYVPGKLEGDVIVEGVNTKDTEEILATSVGLTFEDPDRQIVMLTVEDDLEFGPSNIGLEREEIERRVSEVAEVMGLSEIKTRNPRTLSGGQKQCLVIGGVLAMQTKILALDEPLCMLDPLGKRRVLSALRTLKEKGFSIVLTESGIDLDDIIEFADRLVVLYDGEILIDGSPREVIANTEIFEKAHMLTPQIARVALKMGEKNPDNLPLNIDEAIQYVITKLDQKKLSSDVKRDKVDSKKRKKSNEPIIHVSNVCHTYDAYPPVEALKGVSLDIYPQEFVGLIGQNGSGKTTLSYHLVKLLSPTNKDVEIVVGGVDVVSSPLPTVIEKINYVFQNPDHQFFCEKVRQEIDYGLEQKNLPAEEIERKRNEVCKRLGIEDILDEYVMDLSREKKMYLALASVLVLDPEILIVDEPTTGLDYYGSIHVMNLLKELNKEGKTIVVISHNMSMISEYCERIIVMSDGLIILDDSTREVFCKPEVLEKAWITPPPICQVAQGLEEYGFPPDVLTTDEMHDLVSRALGSE